MAKRSRFYLDIQLAAAIIRSTRKRVIPFDETPPEEEIMNVQVGIMEGNIKMLFETQTAERFEEIGSQVFAERSTYNLLAEKASKVWIDGNLVKDTHATPTHVAVRQGDGNLTSKPIPPRPGQILPQGLSCA